MLRELVKAVYEMLKGSENKISSRKCREYTFCEGGAAAVRSRSVIKMHKGRGEKKDERGGAYRHRDDGQTDREREREKERQSGTERKREKDKDRTRERERETMK